MSDYDDFQKYKKEYEDQQEKELSEDLKKFDERPKPPWYKDPGTISIQGIPEEPPGDIDQPEDENSIEPIGPSSISNELLAAIADANGMSSPEDRKRAVADMNKKFEKEIHNIRSGVLDGGKGVFFTDPGNGKEYKIDYE